MSIQLNNIFRKILLSICFLVSINAITALDTSHEDQKDIIIVDDHGYLIDEYTQRDTDDQDVQECINYDDSNNQNPDGHKKNKCTFNGNNVSNDNYSNNKHCKSNILSSFQYTQNYTSNEQSDESNNIVINLYNKFDIPLYQDKERVKHYSRDVKEVCNGDIMAIFISNNLIADIDTIMHKIDMVGANAVIVNVKDDMGRITFGNDNGIKTNLRCRCIIPDMKHKIDQLKKRSIYTIARIVTYKDPALLMDPKHYELYILKQNPQSNMTIQQSDIWVDKENMYWLNPYNPKTTEYLLQVIKAACMLGFDEIHLDYIRFSTYLNKEIESYNKHDVQISRSQAITNFVIQAKNVVDQYNKKLSIAIYGIVPIEAYTHLIEHTRNKQKNKDQAVRHDISKIDAYQGTMDIIGQNYNALCKIVDYVCPMIYPSHFPFGSFNIKSPDLHPYKIIDESLRRACFVNGCYNHKAEIRPYLQCFTAIWLPQNRHLRYTAHELDQQISACTKNNLYSFYLFNNSGKYDIYYKNQNHTIESQTAESNQAM